MILSNKLIVDSCIFMHVYLTLSGVGNSFVVKVGRYVHPFSLILCAVYCVAAIL